MIVPYCSSDTWAGTGRSEVTGYYFHGKHIFRSAVTIHNNHDHIMSILCRDVLNSLSHHYGLFSATDFVLSGSSAGGFGEDLMIIMTVTMMIMMMMKVWASTVTMLLTGCSEPTPA